MKLKSPIPALALLLVVTGLALTQSSVERPRWVLGGGASDSASGDQSLTLRATLGQPVVGVVSGGGGEVTLAQGFWHGDGLPESRYEIHLPLVIRG